MATAMRFDLTKFSIALYATRLPKAEYHSEAAAALNNETDS